MRTTPSLTHRARAALLAIAFLLALLLVWQALVGGSGDAGASMDAEYAAMMGAAAKGGSALPTPGDVGRAIAGHLASPLQYPGTQQPGLLLHVGYSLVRVLIGFSLAVAVAVPLGFLIGMSPTMHGALDPFIQVLKPVSPLAWLPLALYTIKDAQTSAIFVIFICSIWPTLVNTAFGVMRVRTEWINVARTLQTSRLRLVRRVLLPAALPTVLAGMRISIGIGWLVIVAAEMLVGGTGIGYFIWNEWNNLQIANIIVAILAIGLVGVALDGMLAALGRRFSYAE
ncbi:nitrate ABC transporter permease [Hydrogenophaga sp.]|uniref:nitrate ABC transporter permease n=1 Tax=Hydrogenophaga sp. TaxID=1904254 RepID=UPI003F6FAE47